VIHESFSFSEAEACLLNVWKIKYRTHADSRAGNMSLVDGLNGSF